MTGSLVSRLAALFPIGLLYREGQVLFETRKNDRVCLVSKRPGATGKTSQ